MTGDQIVDWALRILMGVLTVWVFLWGKSAKQAEALLAAQLEVRDNRIAEILRRLDRAGQQSSDLSDRIQVLVTRDEFKSEHRLRSEQIRVLNVNQGVLQTSQVRLEEQVHGINRMLGEFRLGRRDYDPPQ